VGAGSRDNFCVASGKFIVEKKSLKQGDSELGVDCRIGDV
jgi:hypothetical protein